MIGPFYVDGEFYWSEDPIITYADVTWMGEVKQWYLYCSTKWRKIELVSRTMTVMRLETELMSVPCGMDKLLVSLMEG